MNGVVIKELRQLHDDRGWLVETYWEDEIGYDPVMSYASMTKPGMVRGPHEHLEQSDYFCFFDDFRLYLWDDRSDSPTYGQRRFFDVTGRTHMAFVPPKVVHPYKNVGSTNGLVINMPDRLCKGKDKAKTVDEVRHENDPASVYKVD